MDSALEMLVLDARVSLRRVAVPRCAVCRAVFASRAALRAHAPTHHGGRNVPRTNNYTCNECGNQFHSKLKLSLHEKCHSGLIDYQCNVCSGSFRKISHLRIHIRSKHKTYKRICDICLWAFKRRAELLTHACNRQVYKTKRDVFSRAKESKNVYLCNVCRKEFDNMTELNIHKIVHNSNHRDVCQNIFSPKSHPHKDLLDSKKQDNAEHQINVNEVIKKIEPFNQGDICLKKLTPKSHLHKNLLKPKKYDVTEHETDKIAYTINQHDVCQKKFTPNSNPHKTLHKSKEPVIAEQGRDVKNSQSVESSDVLKGCNTQENNNASEKMSHVCDECGRSFKSKLCFDYHMNKHLGINPFTCELCGKAYPSPTSLSIHFRAHKEERIFSCDTCPKTFKQVSQLRNHKETHVRPHPYQCDECKMTFHFKCDFVRHMKVHNRIRPFKCDMCWRAFSFKGNLSRHMREKHLNILPFVCNICLKSFSSNSVLSRHQLTSVCTRRVISGNKRGPKKRKTFAIEAERGIGKGKRKNHANFQSSMKPGNSISADSQQQNYSPQIPANQDTIKPKIKRQYEKTPKKGKTVSALEHTSQTNGAGNKVSNTETQKSIYNSELDTMSTDFHLDVDTEIPEEEYTIQRKKAEYVPESGPYGNSSNFLEENTYSTTDHISWVDGGLLLYMTEDADSKRFACIGLHPSHENSVEHEYTGVL